MEPGFIPDANTRQLCNGPFMSTSALAAGKRLVGDVQAHDLNHADEVLYAFIDKADGLFAGE